MQSEREPLLADQLHDHVADTSISTSSSLFIALQQRKLGHRIRIVLFVIATGFFGFVAGIIWTTSYFIRPVRAACSPPWSSSSTVYGTSAMAVGWILVTPLGICLSNSTLIGWLLVGILMAAISNGIAGLTVMFCEQLGLAGEFVYIGTFSFWSLGVSIGYIVCGEVGVYCLPKRPGIAGGVFPFFIGIGSLVITQIIIALRNVFNDYHVNVGTIFLVIGIIIVVVASPWISVLSLLQQDPKMSVQKDGKAINSSSKWSNVWTLVKASRTWAFSVVVVCGFIPCFAILMYQEPIVISLWNTPHPPISTLSFILMAMYVISRGLWVMASDKVGMKRVWLLGLAFQSFLILCLAVLVSVDNTDTWVRYASMSILCTYMIINPIFKITLFGLCYYLFSSEQRVPAVSIFCGLSGIAGVAAPLVIDTTYNHFGSYKQFFYGSAILSIIGFVILLSIKPASCQGTVEEKGNDCRGRVTQIE